MARILMTWELGGGYGHLAPLLALAMPLKARGHEIAFAARDLKTAAALLDGTGIAVHQAPANLETAQGLTLHSFPQILLNTCFNDPEQLHARVQAWRKLYAEFKPDLLVSDHSPTALLAARGLNFPKLPIGYGFLVPPDVTPLPSLRPWLDAVPVDLVKDEARALDMANGVLVRLGVERLKSIAKLYNAPRQPLFTFKELDNYAAERKRGEYWGPLVVSSGKRPQWPAGDGKRIFVYLRTFQTLPALLESLRAAGQPTLIHVPGLAPELRAQYAGGNLGFSEELLDIPSVARECDLAVLHGGHGTLALMLLAGKPLLLLPLHLEMLINTQAAVKLGAALAAPQLKPVGMRQKLERLLQEPAWGEAARRFAERYAKSEVERIPDNFAALSEKLIA